MSEYEKRGYLLENFRLFHLVSTQHAPVDAHYHEFCKLLLLVSGKGSYVVDGQRYLLRPGDVVLVGSRSIHRPEMEPDTAYERIIIYISPEFLQCGSAENCQLSELFSGERGHVLRLKDGKKIFSLAGALEKELSGQEYGRTILSSAMLLQLLVELGRKFRQKETQHPMPVKPRNSRILEIMSYIDNHLAEDLDIDQLAERFYISKYHMMRQFHKETGFTIHTYLSHRRLIHARELISGGMRATEACYRSGFRCYSSFTRAYGKHFGTTPTGRMDAAQGREEGFE